MDLFGFASAGALPFLSQWFIDKKQDKPAAHEVLIMIPPIAISPHLASPVGEGQMPLLLDYQSVINIQE